MQEFTRFRTVLGRVHAERSAQTRGQPKREVSPKLRIGFAYPSAEPPVWLPDIVAGAVSAARGDGDEQYERPLARLLTVHMIELK